MRRHAFILAATLLIPGIAASQTVYKWVDEDGEVHYSQSLPPERTDEAHEQLASDGRITARIERAPSREERERLAEELAREADEQERARIRASQDRLLLAAYPTEEDLVRSMQAELGRIDSELLSLHASLESARGYFSELVTRAAERERRAEPVPEELAERIQSARATIERLSGQVSRARERRARREAEYRDDLARYRAIQSASHG